MMTLSKDIISEIIQLWTYDYPSAGIAAFKLLDSFADKVLSGEKISIPSDNLVIDNLLDFLTWKSKQAIISEISILNDKNQLEKAEIVDKLISDNRIKTIILSNNSKRLVIVGDDKQFKIDIGDVLRGDRLPDNEFQISNSQVTFLTYYEYKISFVLVENINVQERNGQIKFVCNKLDLK